MDDDAPVLLGRLDIKLKDQHNTTTTAASSSSSSCSGYVPPLALFPELVTSSSAALLIAQQQQQQANSQSSGKSSSNKKSQQAQQPYVLPGTPVIASEGSTSSSSATTSSTSRINRNRSSWDVAALTAFRDGVNVPQHQQQGNIASKSSSSARDAIAALLQSGRLPGTSSSVQQQSQSQSQQQLPSTTDIVKALDRFASNLGVTNEQEAAALRSLHFLHLLGYQRLQQLDGNLKMLLLSGGTENDNNNNKKPTSSSTTSEKLLHQPFKMFEGEQQQEGNKNKNKKNDPSSSSSSWVQSRSKLYDAVLELTTSKDNNEKNNHKAFWVPPQAPAKTSIEVQTSTEIEQQETGAINWYHPENKRDSVQATSIKANEKVPCRFSLSSSSSASSSLKQETGYSLVVSLKKVVDRERLVVVNSNTGNDAEQQQQQQQWEPVQVDESEHVKIPLSSHRVVVGRSVSAGTIRERDSNNNIDVDDDDASSIDPWHIDLSSIVRKLTKNLDHGLYISKQHFVLMLSSNDSNRSITILPCSRNMIRVNGSVVFAAPKTVSLSSTSSSDVVITIGSGNTSPAGVVIQVKIVKEELSN